MQVKDFENKIICGNNVNVMYGIPDGSIDAVITSPPYGSIRDYLGFMFRPNEVARQLYRIMRPGAVCVWVIGDTVEKGFKTAEPFKQALVFLEQGFKLYDTLIYERTGSSYPTKNRYTQCFDFMFIFSKGKPTTVNLIRDEPRKWLGAWGSTTQRQKDGSLKPSQAKNNKAGRAGKAIGNEYGYKARSAIWRIKNGAGFGHNDDLAKQHPGTFPQSLARDNILTWSLPGELILDPFVGSGTTCQQAKALGRRYTGIDVSEEYCQLAEKRVALAATTVAEKSV